MKRMDTPIVGLLLLFTIPTGQLAAQAGFAAPAASTIPAGTPMPVKIVGPLPMKVGAAVRAQLIYPVYANNLLVLAEGTPIVGSVAALRSDHSRRVNARLGGDFTPFDVPTVQFTGVVLPDGTVLPFSASAAQNGAPIFRAVAPPPTHGGFLHQEFDAALAAARDDAALVLAPGKADRLRQLLYSQLPYHPQRIEPGTAWTIETTAALTVPAMAPAPPPAPAPPARKPHLWEPRAPAAAQRNQDASTWMIEAYLAESLSSESTAAGQAIQAVVARPIYNPDKSVAVPQGATLIGTVTRAKPSRRFGRTGVLSFNFQQLTMPGEQEQRAVETRLAGADSAQDIALNSEGQAKSKPQDKLALPLFLALLASRPLDQGEGGQGRQLGKDAVGGAAGLGLVGTVVGLATRSAYTAAGIGYWGAARAFYSRWIGRGQRIAFPKDTRIVVETTPRRAAAIKPDSDRKP